MKNELLKLYRWVFARPQFYSFNLHLYKIVLRGLGVLNAEGPDVTGENWLQRHLATKYNIKVIVDVGANTDVFGIDAFPDAKIFACEPHPRTFLKLKKIIAKAPNRKKIKVLNIGLSDKTGKTTLWDFADDAAGKPAQPTSTLSSLNKNIIEHLHGQKAAGFPITLTTLDALVSKEKIRQISVLKIDTEGYELSVLKGAKKTLAQNKVDVIVFEFNEMNSFTQTFMRDFRQLLPQYDFYRLLPYGLIPLRTYRPLESEIFGFQNIVCLRRDK